MSATDVELSWQRIRAWAERFTPAVAATFRPPATHDDLAAADDAMGIALPADLLAWWSLMDGVTEDAARAGSLLPPFYDPYPVRAALASRQRWLRIWHEPNLSVDADHIAEMSAQPAGSECGFTWLPSWLPVAGDGGGDDLFVDLRPGPLHGCVMTFDKVEGANGGPQWTSVAAMLGDIADALEHRSVLEVDNHPPTLVGLLDDGRLKWLDIDET